MTDPAKIAKDLRNNAAFLKSWFDSVTSNQKEAIFYGNYGVERAASDALECGFRLAASMADAMNKTADALEELAAVRAVLQEKG
jgi:hypothetical protein